MEQIRLANQERFGRHTEKLEEITGQLSFFNEAEAFCDGQADEPSMGNVVETVIKPARKPKKKGQREENLKDFPQEVIPHDVSKEELDALFGEGNYKSMPDEVCWQLRFEPAKWIAEKHVIKCMWEQTGSIRMNSFVAIIPKPYTKAVLQPLPFLRRSLTRSM